MLSFIMNNLHRKIKEIKKIWIDEPRWSYYGTPLRKRYATVVILEDVEVVDKSGIIPTKVTLTTLRGLLTPIVSVLDQEDERLNMYFIYLTHEEYVLFKLSHDLGDIVNNDIFLHGVVYN